MKSAARSLDAHALDQDFNDLKRVKYLTRPIESSTSGSSSSGEAKQKKNRLYDDNYLKCDFTIANNKPQGFICCDILSRGSMKPFEVLYYLNTKHPNKKNKPQELFQRKLQILYQHQNTLVNIDVKYK